jgi:SAM-dependent methyltransferase
MGIKSRFLYLAGLFLNDIEEAIVPSKQAGWMINNGIHHAFGRMSYGERLVELPFVFKHIKNPPAKVLDIGCVESSLSIQLAMMGYNVTSIDIRQYKYEHENCYFIKGNFLSHNFGSKFDSILGISAIEHFGLKAYRGLEQDAEADKKAVRKVASLLNDNGQFIFTAPCGYHETIGTFERIYDESDINSLLKDFKIVDKDFYIVVNEKTIKKSVPNISRKAKTQRKEWLWSYSC